MANAVMPPRNYRWDETRLDVIGFAIHLMSAVTLLLFSVRFMRIGIERLWSQHIRQSLSAQTSAISLIIKGMGFGFAMQGATVVMLLAAGLAGSGTIPLLSAAFVAIGADFGSALAAQALTLPIAAVGPLALLVGGWLYLNVTVPNQRNFGRVILGLGLIFLSLGLIRSAVAPLNEFPATSAVLAYLNADLITAALAGAGLTFVMHSSLAALLTAIAFASHGQLTLVASLAFVLGCNIGSALLPVWLLRAETGAGPSVARSVAVLRIGLAVAFLMILSAFSGALTRALTYPGDHLILLGHVGFNLALIVLAPLMPRVLKFFPAPPKKEELDAFILPQGESDPHILAMALKGQVNRMLDLLMQMYDLVTGPSRDTSRVSEWEFRINSALASIRHAYTQMPETSGERADQIRQILDFAIRIEASADVLKGKYLTIRQEAMQGDFTFSDEGGNEIAVIVEQVRKGLMLAQSVFWSEEVHAARQLVKHKQNVATLESNSRQAHLARVRNGNLASLGSSDAHLELIAALKTINSKLATVGYAVLGARGELIESRLVPDK